MTRRVDARGRAERGVRAAWEGEPGPLSSLGAALFGAAADLRNLLYAAGLLKACRPALPVISVGGLTVGGSGKTPIAAEIGGWLSEHGPRVAIVTRGFRDELRVHADLNPSAVVLGHPDRERAVRRAAALGAEVAVLDDGFQHRRLGRRVELVVVDLDTFRPGELRRLPAGPFRARWAELGRADAIVIARRLGTERASRMLADRLRLLTAAAVVAECRLAPGALRPGNGRASRIRDPSPAVAVASIMKPVTFFRQLRQKGLAPAHEYVFPDHGGPDEELAEEMVEVAGEDGMVGTLKDIGRLAEVAGRRTPVWYLEDRLEWEREGDGLRRCLVREVRTGREPAGGAVAARTPAAGAATEG